MLPYWV